MTSSEETAWSIAVLKEVLQKEEDAIGRGCGYLDKTRHVSGGWGQTKRDIPRIPTTVLVCELVPELADKRAIDWISQEWEKDLESSVQLSYKAGFFLLAAGNKKEWIGSDLVEKTIEYLVGYFGGASALRKADPKTLSNRRFKWDSAKDPIQPKNLRNWILGNDFARIVTDNA